MSDRKDYPLAQPLGRTDSNSSVAALAADRMEQVNSLAVVTAQQMAPLCSAAALATEVMVPYLSTAVLVAERMAPLLRAMALAARQMEPFLEAMALVVGQLGSAINSLAKATAFQKGSALSLRAIANKNTITASVQEPFVSEYEVLDMSLVLPSVSGTKHFNFES